MEKRKQILIGCVFLITFYSFFLNKICIGANENDKASIKSIEIHKLNKANNEQLTIIKIELNLISGSIKDNIDYILVRDANWQIYEFNLEEFHSTNLGDYYLKEIPFFLPVGELEFIVQSKFGGKYKIIIPLRN